MNTISSPLTSNVLNTHDRARLLRSTRKLEAILGTTPHVTEVQPIHVTLPPLHNKPPPSPRTKASRRHGSIFTIFPIIPPAAENEIYASSSTNSSVTSLTVQPEPYSNAEVLPTPKSFSSRPRRSAEAPRPLMLRVNVLPVGPSDNRVPLSPYSPFVTSSRAKEDGVASPLLSGMPRELSETEVRRKRMAKLARTFGENVPPEYVFPTSRNPSSVLRQHRHPEGKPKQQHSPRPSSQVWTTGSAGAWTGAWNRKDIGEVQHKLRTLRAK
ncbi:hypothetical protein BDW22DRAFT_1361641 [Trametopsis cervina]|nr:hypothetical protein BDW22DRAFT_1361641 [Trametopsis cervina]